MNMNEFKAWWKSMDASTIKANAEQMAADVQALAPGASITLYFSYGSYNLGNSLWL